MLNIIEMLLLYVQWKLEYIRYLKRKKLFWMQMFLLRFFLVPRRPILFFTNKTDLHLDIYHLDIGFRD